MLGFNRFQFIDEREPIHKFKLEKEDNKPYVPPPHPPSKLLLSLLGRTK